MPRARVLVLVVGLLVLAALVAASSSWESGDAGARDERGGEETAGSDRLRGPEVPPEGALPGRLWAVLGAGASVDAACQLRAIDLRALELEPPGELRHCTLVDVALDGRYAVAFDEGARLALIDLRGRPETVRELESSLRGRSVRNRRIAAVSHDGTEVAWCVTANEVAVLSLEEGRERRSIGCDPRFGPNGELYTRTLPPLPDEIRLDGQVVLASEEFRQGLELEADAQSHLLAYDVGGGGLIATKVRRALGPPQPTIQLWNGRTPAAFHRVSGIAGPLQSGGVELSPDETRVALGWRGLLAGVLDFGFRRVSRTLDHGSYAWSPDGRWLAIGEPRGIAIYARGSDAATYVLPVSALMLGWSE